MKFVALYISFLLLSTGVESVENIDWPAQVNRADQIEAEGSTVSPLEEDSLALVALYNATAGPNWVRDMHWFEGPLDSWDGVSVENGRVVSVRLDSVGLKGFLPSDIGELDGLSTLYLRFNDLEGAIPPEIGNLSNLEYLYLNGNLFTGVIPATLGNLTKLEVLNLAGRGAELVGPIPASFGNLVNLEVLDLSFNRIDGAIPPELSALSNLKQLDLYFNPLEGSIPAALGDLANLETLDLSHNRLTGSVPQELTNLSRLKHLRINHNRLTDLPALTSLDSLITLFVHRNKFTFEDLESNVSVASNQFNYTPQDTSVGISRTEALTIGDDLTMHFTLEGLHNEYQWYKFDEAIPGAVDDTYSITSATAGDAGIYTLQITNTEATELTLTTAPITVAVYEPRENTGSVYLNSLAGIEEDFFRSANPDGFVIKDSTMSIEAWVFPTDAPSEGESLIIAGRPSSYLLSLVNDSRWGVAYAFTLYYDVPWEYLLVALYW